MVEIGAVHAADVTIDLTTNAVTMHKRTAEPWKVTLVDTGLDDDGRPTRPAARAPE